MNKLDWISTKIALPAPDYEGDDGQRSVLIRCVNDGETHYYIDRATYPSDGNVWACTSKNCVTHWREIPVL